jgi:hypothetical protein
MAEASGRGIVMLYAEDEGAGGVPAARRRVPASLMTQWLVASCAAMAERTSASDIFLNCCKVRKAEHCARDGALKPEQILKESRYASV